jgi:hypothetical protein
LECATREIIAAGAGVIIYVRRVRDDPFAALPTKPSIRR